MRTLLVAILLAMLGTSVPAQTDTPSVPSLDEPAPAQAPAPTPMPAPAQPANPIPASRPRRSTAPPATAAPSRRAAPAAKATVKATNGKRRATPAKAASGKTAQAQVTRRPSAARQTAAPAAEPALPALPPLDGDQAPQGPAQDQAPAQAAAPAPDNEVDAAARAQEAQAIAAIPQNFKLDVRLERIRVQRSRTFSRSTTEADPAEEAQWANEMTMQIKVNPPREWDVISIDHASIQQVLDQNGRPLPQVQQVGALPPSSAAPDLNPMEPLFRKVDSGALLLLRMVPPPSGTQAFKSLDAHIQTRLGYRRPITVSDLRARIGQNFLHSTGVSDLVMEVSDIGDDFIEVMALGELDRVGPMTFTDNAGKRVNPYNSEVVSREAGPQGSRPGKVWRFAFSKVPAKINMSLTLYRIVSPRNMTVKFTNVPLP